MKKIFKKIGNIVGIGLVVIFAIGFFGFAYLYLVPNSHIFNIKYVSNKNSLYYDLGNYSGKTINLITVQTTKYRIKTEMDSEATNIRVFVKNNVFGLGEIKNSYSDLVYTYNNNTGELNIKTEEPKGLISCGDSYIEILLPQYIIDDNLALNISTGAKAWVEVKNINTVKISSLSIKTNKGSINLDNINTKELKIATKCGKITIGENIGSIDDLFLDIGESNANFLSVSSVKAELNNASMYNREPISSNVSFNIKNLVVKNLKAKSKIKIFKCDNLISYGGAGRKIAGGTIECLFVNSKFDFYSVNCNLKIGSVLGETPSCFYASKNGGLAITGEIKTVLNVGAVSGVININKMENEGCFSIVNGKLTIGGATKALQVIGSDATIDIKFQESCLEYIDGINSYRKISLLRIKDDRVNIQGLNSINMLVEDGGEAEVKLSYKRLVGDNNLYAKKSNLVVIVPQNEPVNLVVDSDGAIVRSDVGTATRLMSRLDGIYNEVVYANSTTNNLNIYTSGMVSLYSSDVYYL